MIRFALPLIALLAASPAFAHTGHDHTLVDGLFHPFSGLDHIAAMVAVGLVALTAMPKRALLAPALFLTGLAGGALAARFGYVMPGYETAILVSLIALGGLAAYGRAVPVEAVVVALVAFGAAHGAAHGVEAPSAEFPLYMGGFVAASAALHGLGLGFASFARDRGLSVLVRIGGALVAMSGLALAFGA
jgi:urease accessory protein